MGNRQNPRAGRQWTNFFGEVIGPDAVTRRFLSAVPFTMLDPGVLADELRAARFAPLHAHDPFAGSRLPQLSRHGWRLMACEAVQ